MSVIRDPIRGVIGSGKAGVLVTGQTTSLVTGDDGDLQAGVPKSYTLLTTGQYSGITNITVNSKVEQLENTCVIDNATDLMWSRKRPNEIGPSSDGALYWTDGVNNETIFEFKVQANIQSFAGHADWRVPNRNELETLIISEAPALFIDETVFDNITFLSSIWTSSSDPLNTGTNGVVVHFSSSGNGFKPKNTTAPTFLVRNA